MQFKDAAYEILKRAGKPLHFNELTGTGLHVLKDYENNLLEN
jgi:hypothetical protein